MVPRTRTGGAEPGADHAADWTVLSPPDQCAAGMVGPTACRDQSTTHLSMSPGTTFSPMNLQSHHIANIDG